MAVELKLMTNQECKRKYDAEIEKNNWIGNYSLCARNKGKDSCQGDSGGPLVCNIDGKAVSSGIVSGGTGCADPRFPGIYTNVYHFIDFINSVINTDATPAPTPAPAPTNCCPCSQWIGDGYCDDCANTEECDYDGGDCCFEPLVKGSCTQCECLLVD
jgi:hypothetical protein